MMYNLYFNDENFNQDKLRAERIIKKINDKFANNKKSEKKELNKDERDELLLVRQLLIKILKYQFTL